MRFDPDIGILPLTCGSKTAFAGMIAVVVAVALETLAQVTAATVTESPNYRYLFVKCGGLTPFSINSSPQQLPAAWLVPYNRLSQRRIHLPLRHGPSIAAIGGCWVCGCLSAASSTDPADGEKRKEQPVTRADSFVSFSWPFKKIKKTANRHIDSQPPDFYRMIP